MSRDERDLYTARLDKYYLAGTWYGQSASGTLYILATTLERVDNELLWSVLPSHALFFIKKKVSP
jgi:cell division control protein 45